MDSDTWRAETATIDVYMLVMFCCVTFVYLVIIVFVLSGDVTRGDYHNTLFLASA